MTICIIVGTVTIVICISISHLFQSKVEIVKNDKINRKLLEFLDKADDAYMEGYSKSKMELFADYMTPELCEIICEEMEQGGKKLFGPKNARERKWYLLEGGKDNYKLKKILTHKKLKQGTVSISLGDCIEETWSVATRNDSYIVLDII